VELTLSIPPPLIGAELRLPDPTESAAGNERDVTWELLKVMLDVKVSVPVVLFPVKEFAVAVPLPPEKLMTPDNWLAAWALEIAMSN
jgi:hypothetical protein